MWTDTSRGSRQLAREAHSYMKHHASMSRQNSVSPSPRLLIVSEVIPETSYAGSLLLHRLLSDYPAERLLVLGPRPQDTSTCLDCEYRVLEPPFARLTKTRLSRALNTAKAFSLGLIGH